MAAPSEATIKTMVQNGVDVLEDTRSALDAIFTTSGQVDVLQLALAGDLGVPLSAAAVESFRGAASACLDARMARAFLDGPLLEYGKVISSPGYPGDVERVFRDLYRYYKANTLTIKSRNITYAAGSLGGSNVGNGAVPARLTVDENNYKLEGETVELKTMRCTRDQTTGARKHAEEFAFYGKQGPRDALDWSTHGSGASRSIFSHHAGQGQGGGGSLAVNGSWSDYDSAGSVTTKFPGWTIDTLANVTQDTTDYYRGFPGSAENLTGGQTDASLSFTGNAILSQKFGDVGITIDPATPYFMRVMVMRKSSATGTVRIRMGASTATVALSSLTNDVWTELLIALGTGCWPKVFDEANPDLTVEVSSLAVGSVRVDDLLFAPFDDFDGTWWFLRGGSTAWLLDDSWSGTDTEGTNAKIQNWLRRGRYGYLPSTTGTPSMADP